eukprot:254458-Chlamydomonas_euryale.AAC.3
MNANTHRSVACCGPARRVWPHLLLDLDLRGDHHVGVLVRRLAVALRSADAQNRLWHCAAAAGARMHAAVAAAAANVNAKQLCRCDRSPRSAQHEGA